MAVTLESGSGIKRFRGLSSDEKPGRVPIEIGDPVGELPPGSVFTEIDTGERYIWDGTWPWLRQEQTIETMFQDLMHINRQMLAYLKATHEGNELYVWEEDVEVDTF